MSFGAVIPDLNALAALDMATAGPGDTPITYEVFLLVKSEMCLYLYDPNSTETQNNQVNVPATGGGCWHAFVPMLTGQTAPTTGINAAFQVLFMLFATDSNSVTKTTNLYANQGGGNNVWTETGLNV